MTVVVILSGVLPSPAVTNEGSPASLPSAGDVHALDLGGGETLEFAWWPPGSGPRTDAAVRRVPPQPGLWSGDVEWRSVGPMAAATREGTWVARHALTAAQRAKILWPGAAATTSVDVVTALLNARVTGGGFAVVPGGGAVLTRRCGAEAAWRQAALETRAVELGDGLRLEMQGLSEGVPGGGFWAAREVLSAAQQARILWPGAPATTSVDTVVTWLNARVAGGGFATEPSGGAVLMRRCGAEAGWRQAALETRAVELGDGLRLEMQGRSEGLPGGGFWAAREVLSAAQQARILWPGAPATTSVDTVVTWLNARVAGGGFATVPGGGDVLMRRCGAEAGWRQAALETRAVELGEAPALEMLRVPDGVPGGGCWVAQRAMTAGDRKDILWPGAPVDAQTKEVVAWLNARVGGGGFAEATAEERRNAPEGSGSVLTRRCGADAGWRQAVLETRTVELGDGCALEMVRVPTGLPGGGDWLATQALTSAQRERILWPGATATTAVDTVVTWLNARVAGGGFTSVPSGGAVLRRRCGAEAGWQQSALETRAVDLGDGLRLEMQGLSEGLPDGGFWAAREALSAAQQARILPRGASADHASLAAVAMRLNRGVAGGGFAVAEGGGGWLVRHGSNGDGWQCVELERTVTLGGDVQLELVWCPPGAFLMGSPRGERGRDDDEQQHPVTLTKGFWMGTCEVTQAQWERVMGNNPSYFSGPDLPVERVSWNGCQAFLSKLNAIVPGGGFRLPAEAEWEYACRAGTTSAYGGYLDEMAWYEENSKRKTHAVGTKQPNAWGLYDMPGNVREWCQDWYGAYPFGSVNDPAGPSSGASRVIRGGCWNYDAGYCRVAYRYGYYRADFANAGVGFRVVLSPGS